MSDAQLTAILLALTTIAGGIGTVLKWAASRIVKALDDNSASNGAIAASNVEQAKQFAILSTKIDGLVITVSPKVQPPATAELDVLAGQIGELSDRVDGLTPIEGTPVTAPTHPARPSVLGPPARRATPAQGRPIANVIGRRPLTEDH